MQNKNRYPKNWSSISREYRRKKKWRCEACGRIETRKQPNHTDHRDGNPGNNKESNYQVLCPRCHLKKGIFTGQINNSLANHIKIRTFGGKFLCL